jgi:hypothetical protein
MSATPGWHVMRACHRGAQQSLLFMRRKPTTVTGASTTGIMTLKNRTSTPMARLFADCARDVSAPLAKDE